MPEASDTTRTVLVVDDEDFVRILGVDIFSSAGFQVIEAANAEEALELLEAFSGVHLLFTDINMPGAIDGVALAHLVVEQWPHIGIIIVSGQGIPQALPQGSRFHSKPYDAQQVLEHARELTAR